MKVIKYILPVVIVNLYIHTIKYLGPWFQRENLYLDLLLNYLIKLEDNTKITFEIKYETGMWFQFILDRVFDFVYFIPFLLALFIITIPKKTMFILVMATFLFNEILLYATVRFSNENMTPRLIMVACYWLFFLPSLCFVNKLFGIENRTQK